ncbi:hypothetical protein KKI23_01515 [Patescibacteria group bacterium]|nr:hypothetical protein [Patescibacteria group bacterium]
MILRSIFALILVSSFSLLGAGCWLQSTPEDLTNQAEIISTTTFHAGERVSFKESEVLVSPDEGVQVTLARIFYMPCKQAGLCNWSGLAASFDVIEPGIESPTRVNLTIDNPEIRVGIYNMRLTHVNEYAVDLIFTEVAPIIVNQDNGT